MARSSRRGGKPTDPQVMLMQRREAEARARADASAADRSPERWGVAPGIGRLATSGDVDLVADGRKVLAAERRDPFDLLYARRGLSMGQHQAVRRLIGDLLLRAGVSTDATAMLGVRVQRDPTSGLVSDRMLAAGARVFATYHALGRLNGLILSALIGPLLDLGHVADWRAQVERVTGEDDATGQAAAVRLACEALRGYYAAVDMGAAPANDAPAFWLTREAAAS